jgi:hypothetical protein
MIVRERATFLRRVGVFFASLLAAGAFVTPASQEQLQEYVTVTAVEVPVRVFDKNGFISGLTKADFEIFENGVRQEITGFEFVSRALAPLPSVLPEALPRAPRRRNFVLIFNVFDYTEQVGEAIDYFFKNIFGPGDRLMIMIEDKFFEIQTGAGIEGNISRLKKTLIMYKKASRFEISKTFQNLDLRASRIAGTLSGEEYDRDYEQQILIFYDDYIRAWKDYRSRMLDVNLDLYRTVIRKLSRAEGEKWAICFQQRDLFPQIKSGGRLERLLDLFAGGGSVFGRLIQARQSEVRRLMDLMENFPAEAIRNLFAEGNITLHLLIMKSMAARARNESRDMDLRDVDMQYEDVLRRISRSTGGLTKFSNKVLDTLKEAAAKEDRYYLLVYQPKDQAGGKEREIEVRVRREGADVVALKKYSGRRASVISISGFEAAGGTVSFTVGNCARLDKMEASTGKVMIKVTVFNDKSEKVFSEAKTLDLIADSLHLSLNFKKLQPGDHYIIVEAVDLVSGEKDVLSRAINW